MTKSKKWVPEIFYEEPDEANLSSQIPFILVPEEEEMPKVLFIFESRKTNEVEPDSEGFEIPIIQMDLHQYADMTCLKNKLSSDTFDLVRAALGLVPLKEAVLRGQKVSDKVLNNIKTPV
jgi:hypothetical protein